MFDDSIVKPITYLDMKGIDAAGGVWSCADDINKWMLFMLDSATVNGKRLLQRETFMELFKPQSMVTASQFYPTARATKPHWTTYGLGWFQEDYRGKMVQFHTGSLDGATAILGLIPDEHFGIYIFGNLDHSGWSGHALMYKAMDLWCFHDNTKDWSGELYTLYKSIKQEAKKNQAKEEATRVMNTHPSLPLQAYSGKYSNDIYGSAEIIFANDYLLLKFPNNINLKLTHWNYDTFSASFLNAWMGKVTLHFTLDDAGKVAQFETDGMVYSKGE